MSGDPGAGAFGCVVMILGIPLLVCDIISLITMLHQSQCVWNVGGFLVVTYLMPLPIAYFSIKEWRNKLTGNIVICISILLCIVGYCLGVVAMVKISKEKDMCLPYWARVMNWISIGVGFLTIILPAVCTIPHYIGLLSHYIEMNKKSREAKEKLIELYEPTANAREIIIKDNDLVVLMNTTKLDKKEVKILLKKYSFIQGTSKNNANIGKTEEDRSSSMIGNGDVDCVMCEGQEESIERRFVSLPNCNHIYHEDCFEKRFTITSIECAVCGANVRKEALKQINNIESL